MMTEKLSKMTEQPETQEGRVPRRTQLRSSIKRSVVTTEQLDVLEEVAKAEKRSRVFGGVTTGSIGLWQ